MVRACRQPLTSSQDEMDAFALVMLAVELERKKIAERDALKSTELNSANETKATVASNTLCEDHEELRTDPPKPEAVS